MLVKSTAQKQLAPKKHFQVVWIKVPYNQIFTNEYTLLALNASCSNAVTYVEASAFSVDTIFVEIMIPAVRLEPQLGGGVEILNSTF